MVDCFTPRWREKIGTVLRLPSDSTNFCPQLTVSSEFTVTTTKWQSDTELQWAKVTSAPYRNCVVTQMTSLNEEYNSPAPPQVSVGELEGQELCRWGVSWLVHPGNGVPWRSEPNHLYRANHKDRRQDFDSPRTACHCWSILSLLLLYSLTFLENWSTGSRKGDDY